MKIITRGHTRIIVLFGDRAIKIARFRPFRLFFRMLLYPFQSLSKQGRFHERYGPMPGGMWKYLTAGYQANRVEYEYWRLTSDSRIMAVMQRHLGYSILIQLRGQEVTIDELKNDDPFRSVHKRFHKSLRAGVPAQFAKRAGRIVLIDFGETETRDALLATLA